MQFKNIIAPEEHVEYFRYAVDHDTLPHAMLFWGHEGTGKLAAALAMTQYLMCRDRQDGDSCGVCANCVKNAKYAHPDVHMVFPIFSSTDKRRATDYYPEWRTAILENPYLGIQDWLNHISAENKQLNIPASECRRIIDQLGLQAFEGHQKVLVVWMAERLGKDANRWLKLIEEPADNTFIILIVTDRNAVLPTILSRCQQFYFKPLSNSVITHELQLKFDMDDNRAARIASASHGNWNLAASIADNSHFNPVKWMESWVRVAWENDAARMRSWSEDMGGMKREENKQYQQYVIDVWQKLYWIKWGIDFEADDEERAMLESLNKKIEFNELEDLVRLSEKNLVAMRRNARPNILWMDATLKLKTALSNYKGRIGA